MELPQEIQDRLARIKEQEDIVYYNSRKDFMESIFAHNKYDDIFKHCSRWQAIKTWRTERRMLNERLLGSERYEAVYDLVQEAKASL